MLILNRMITATIIAAISLIVPIKFALATEFEICKTEPSCSDIEKANENHQEFGNILRCMCDDKCNTYGDCCLDSTNIKSPSVSKYCSKVQNVYMEVTCPHTWTNDEVKQKCEKSDQLLTDSDTYLIQPVTNINTGITYGNKYCSQCNSDDDVQFWKLTAACSEVPISYFNSPDKSITSVNQKSASTTASVKSTTTAATRTTGTVVKSTRKSTRSAIISTKSTSTKMTEDSIYEDDDFIHYPVRGGSGSSLVKTTADNIYEDDDFIYYPIVGSSLVKTTGDSTSEDGFIDRFLSSITGNDHYNLGLADQDIIRWGSAHVRRRRATKVRLDFVKYSKQIDQIVQNATWDDGVKKFRSYYSDKNFVCLFGSRPSEAVKQHVRACVANMVSTCSISNNITTVNKCQSYTALVYDNETRIPYRNEYCAACNGVSEENVVGCVITPRSSSSTSFDTSSRPETGK